jgi:hypothetical protein
MLQAADIGYDEAVYVFGILTVENNNLLAEIEETLVHMGKFITPSLSDPMIRRWIRLVHYDAVLTLRRYEELGWGRFFQPVQISHNACLQGAKC